MRSAIPKACDRRFSSHPITGGAGKRSGPSRVAGTCFGRAAPPALWRERGSVIRSRLPAQVFVAFVDGVHEERQDPILSCQAFDDLRFVQAGRVSMIGRHDETPSDARGRRAGASTQGLPWHRFVERPSGPGCPDAWTLLQEHARPRFRDRPSSRLRGRCRCCGQPTRRSSSRTILAHPNPGSPSTCRWT